MSVMSTEATTSTPVKIDINPWQHYAGSRPTFVTYAALVIMSDDTQIPCGHEGHRTSDAAVTCGRKLFARLTKAGRPVSTVGPFLITNTVCPDSFYGPAGVTRNPDDALQYPTEAAATRAGRRAWSHRARIVTLAQARTTAHFYDPRCDHVEAGARCPRHRRSGHFHCDDHLAEGN